MLIYRVDGISIARDMFPKPAEVEPFSCSALRFGSCGISVATVDIFTDLDQEVVVNGAYEFGTKPSGNSPVSLGIHCREGMRLAFKEHASGGWLHFITPSDSPAYEPASLVFWCETKLDIAIRTK